MAKHGPGVDLRKVEEGGYSQVNVSFKQEETGLNVNNVLRFNFIIPPSAFLFMGHFSVFSNCYMYSISSLWGLLWGSLWGSRVVRNDSPFDPSRDSAFLCKVSPHSPMSAHTHPTPPTSGRFKAL